MSHDIGPLILTRAHEYLLERHARQVLCRSLDDRRALAHLAARAFVPASPGNSESPVFDRVIQPMGHVLLIVLSRWLQENADGAFVETLYARGHIARFDPSAGLTCWDHTTRRFDLNFARLARTNPYNYVAPLRRTGFLRTMLDLDAEIHYRVSLGFKTGGRPALPNTLLAFPKDQTPEPRPTWLVQMHAERRGKPWEWAWRELYDKLTVPDEFNPTEFTLVDHALCGEEYWSKALGAYHDLRGFIDREVYNPMKGRPNRDHEPNAGEINLFRRMISADLAKWVSDEDVTQALKRPSRPFAIRGLSRMQVWRPQNAQDPESFRYTAYGHRVDLWNPHSRWQPPPPETIPPAEAEQLQPTADIATAQIAEVSVTTEAFDIDDPHRQHDGRRGGTRGGGAEEVNIRKNPTVNHKESVPQNMRMQSRGRV